MDEHRTLRLLMFEVWEAGQDFPLFITSDGTEARRELHEGDTLVKRWWVREGAVVGVVAVQAEENPELALDLLLGRASRNGLSDSPTERLDEPGVAGVADELGPLVDGFGEVFGEPQQDVFGHAPMVAPLISASESDSMVAMTTTREDLLTMGHEPDSGDCLCYHSCADDPRSACSLSGDWHVHAGERCPTHPDAPGDW